MGELNSPSIPVGSRVHRVTTTTNNLTKWQKEETKMPKSYALLHRHRKDTSPVYRAVRPSSGLGYDDTVDKRLADEFCMSTITIYAILRRDTATRTRHY
jgi:hypothetical protein